MNCAKILLLVSIVVLIAGIAAAAEADVIYVNFQEAGNPPPLRTGIVHLEDTGAEYGDRGNGYFYGWSDEDWEIVYIADFQLLSKHWLSDLYGDLGKVF